MILPSHKKIILHIDFDSFFASVEQQENPKFRSKPLGVTATNGRNCIIASSKEAKVLGIKTAMAVYVARKIYPDLLLTSADFRKYWKVSQQFIQICKNYSPYLEVFSIDELFMDITHTAHLFGGTDALIADLKQKIQYEIGTEITVSVGVSHNKLLAKLASGLHKPNGVVKITGENMLSVYKNAELTDICGIGQRIQTRLFGMGISTLLQLRLTPLSSLIGEFGTVEGNFLKNVGDGVDESPIVSFTDAPTVKSVGRQYCLPKNEYNKRLVLQNIYELCEEVAIKLRKLNKKTRCVGIGLVGTHNLHGHKTYREYFDSGKELFSICLSVIHEQQPLFDTGYVRRIGVWGTLLEETSITPLSLFERERKNEKLLKTIDSVNEKFGDHTIRNGFLLYADKLTTVPNGFMADRYERTLLAKLPVD